MAVTPKYKLSQTRKDAIKAKYAGKSATYKRAHVATTKGKALKTVAKKKGDYPMRGKTPTDLKKKFEGDRKGYVKAMNARKLAKQHHKAAVLRGRKVAKGKQT